MVVGLQGQLVMLDRYNRLWEATQNPKTGEWVLSPEPRAKLGPGRPLGYHFDHHGDLIVCDSLKVCAWRSASSSASSSSSRQFAATPSKWCAPLFN